jgi:YegS/Rv2252/BmrU family lipid kinase
LRSAALIYNPTAGRQRTQKILEAIPERLRAGAWDTELCPTAGPGDAERLAHEAAARGVEAVFALGGDGTLRECAAGLLGSDTALAFLPAGTANVMALVFGLPPKPLPAAEILARGRTAQMDVGLCAERPFLMQASFGLDAAVIAALRPATKRILGQGAVGPAIARSWWTYGYPEFEVRTEGWSRSASFAAVCNIPFYGGRWKLAPDARTDDRRLDLALFKGKGRWQTLGFACGLLLGRHIRRRDVEISQLEEVEIFAAPELPLQLDGDSFPAAFPTRLRVSRRRLTLLLPARERQ